MNEPGNEIETSPSSSQASPQSCKFKEQLIQKAMSKGKNKKGNKVQHLRMPIIHDLRRSSVHYSYATST
jgi:hypothetical protein